MRAIDFYNLFIERTDPSKIYEKNGQTFFEIYKDLRGYTELVNRHIIPSIISDCNYSVQHEYYRIDVVGWVSRADTIQSEADENRLNAHLWDLKIVVEHENSTRDWTDEVIKLIHIKCPLKVVIGYNNCDLRDGTSHSDADKLQILAGWMRKIDALSVGSNEEYLVILGNAKHSKTGKSDYIGFDYRGYLFDETTGRFNLVGNKEEL